MSYPELLTALHHMSQYISSYLIEPVFRQARRFSRPENPTPEGSDAGSRTSLTFSDGNRIWIGRGDNEDWTFASQGSQRPTSSPHDASTDGAGTIAVRRARGEATDSVSGRATSSSFVDVAEMSYVGESIATGRNSLGGEGSSQPASVVTSELPENDGMGQMRKRILDIHKLNAPSNEKSRLLHTLMMEQYLHSSPTGDLRARSPTSLGSYDRPITPLSGQSNDFVLTESPNTTLSTEEYLHATEEEREPTYYVPPDPERKAASEEAETERAFGCTHYKRNVKLQCSACHRWYTCRFCHDQQEDHCLNRRATKNMLCMTCGSTQPASQVCRTCDRVASWYFCKICKLWDDDTSKKIYHCDGCGICRRGEGLGKDFFHCKVGVAFRSVQFYAYVADLLCLHIDADQGHAQVYRTLDGLRLPHMWGVYVFIA